ncbi:MAG: NAD(P)/FAD-dependent oxidoreductase [Betaproteobacteria bacterium]|nr:NAD(P)/FAD-dependent oxidoreductase [Betaproteobacteria bacterium]
MADRFDIAIVGGGHNGLVCAAYLAAAGKSVCVLEKRDVVGGAAVTEEFHPGFRNSTASYTVSLLNPKIIRDLKLREHGLRIVERPFSNFLPLSDRECIRIGGGLEATQSEVARYSKKDAAALPAYYAMLDRVADVLRDLLLETPPNVGGGIADLFGAIKIGRRFKQLDMAARRDVLDLFTMSAAELLERWFESEPVKACFGFDAVVGNFASPWTPGSAYVLLHHVFGEVNGKPGIWGHAVGGMGAITEAMAKEARSRGAKLRTGVGVANIRKAENGFTVTLESGEALSAARVVANVNPRLLMDKLVDAEALSDELRQRFRHIACESATLRMNVALAELPRFTCSPEPGPHLSSGIIMAPTLDYMDRAHREASEHGWSRNPIVEILIPSTVDDSLAPPGQHVASLFCQHFRYALPDGRSWDDEREAAADRIIDTVTRHAPNFKASVIARQIHTPLDLERKFGLVGGDIFHGKLSLNQLFSARPVLGFGNYRLPVKGLYLCGSGAHPGGGVTGVPGHNCAREILKDG